MWSDYTKTFVFRDCFDEINVEGNVASINKLLNTKQIKDEIGAFICTDLLSTSIATKFEASSDPEDGSWELSFYDKNDFSIANVSLFNYKEVQLQFEIEENLDNGDMSIHHCTIKGFKEYQR